MRNLSLIHQVRATRAFLWKTQLFVPVNRTVWASIHEFLFTHRFFWVDDHQAIFTLVHCIWRRLHAWRVIAMPAHIGPIFNADLRDLPVHLFSHAQPELTRFWLWL